MSFAGFVFCHGNSKFVVVVLLLNRKLLNFSRAHVTVKALGSFVASAVADLTADEMRFRPEPRHTCPTDSHTQMEHVMDITFSPATLLFFSAPRAQAWGLTTSSQILYQGAKGITAKLVGPQASQFQGQGNLALTAWRRARVPYPPPPPRGTGPLPLILPVGWTYVVSDSSDGTRPINVDPFGYLEITMTPNVATVGNDGKPNITNSNNRFAANVQVVGSSAGVGLVLNVVDIFANPQAINFLREPGGPPFLNLTLHQGQAVNSNGM
jgi:hypothetical protein